MDWQMGLASLAPATGIAAVLFSLAWIVLGQVSRGFTIFGNRVAPYSWVAQPVSGLGLGETSRLMNAAFVLTGLLLAAGIIGTLASLPILTGGEVWALGAILLLSPLGMALCGVFDLEHMLPHTIAFLLAMGAPVIGFAGLGWRLARHPAYESLAHGLLVAAVLTLILILVAMRTLDPEVSGRGEGIAGLTQRLLITEVFGAFMLLAWSASRSVGL